jgi:cytochrome c2
MRHVALLIVVMASACARPPGAPAGGDPARGRLAIARAECGACHRIPGIAGAHGRVGPPLDDFARRVYVAGLLPNTPSMLARWIENPPALKPQTAMPALGLDAGTARDIAAYLHQR